VKESRGSDTLIFVVGNKIDLEADRNVNTEKAEAITKALGINYYEVSAKTGRNLN
jgi:Ras-related protein Rab-6A